ncbi:threonine synthase [Protofrankia coriariae]|uniref:threonine synthase n=1 Tax=Protofrankia coriariae TaxID=1562887 RepID=UPI0006403634|nr:pyridoxal-phosphate dependent enzyme [Protofrankia coriariae]
MNRWRCSRCGSDYPLAAHRYLCDRDEGRLGLELDGAAPTITADDTTMWRYADLLPFARDSGGVAAMRARYPCGWTPLTARPGLFGVDDLWVKNEAVNPTGSLKDRASAAVVAAALDHGHRVVAAASTGNAATALAAAVAAAGGLDCVVFVPGRVTAARVARLRGFGATVLVVDGDYDTAVRLSLDACAGFGWYCRTTAINPYTTQGKKTAALEIAEQLAGHAPDAVVVAVGDGNILVGLHHGFRDAVRAGLLDRVPRLIGVQATGARAVYRAWAAGATEVAPAPADTVAAGISVGDPMDGTRALAALRDTAGLAVTVTDAEITAAVTRLAAAGIGAEPSSATAFAALPALLSGGELAPHHRVVVINTGDGALLGHPVPASEPRVAPTVSAVRAATPALPHGVPGIFAAHAHP